MDDCGCCWLMPPPIDGIEYCFHAWLISYLSGCPLQSISGQPLASPVQAWKPGADLEFWQFGYWAVHLCHHAPQTAMTLPSCAPNLMIWFASHIQNLHVNFQMQNRFPALSSLWQTPGFPFLSHLRKRLIIMPRMTLFLFMTLVSC